jgi:hypothetical protein
MRAAPGLVQLHATEILHLDKFLASGQISLPTLLQWQFTSFVHRDNFPVIYQPCTAIAPAPNKTPAMTAKTRAIPSSHRDNLLAKVPGPCPDATSGNAH